MAPVGRAPLKLHPDQVGDSPAMEMFKLTLMALFLLLWVALVILSIQWCTIERNRAARRRFLDGQGRDRSDDYESLDQIYLDEFSYGQSSSFSGRFRGGSRPSPTPSPQGSQSSSNLAPRVPALPSSPSLSQSISMEESGRASPTSDPLAAYNLPRPKPLWLNAAYAKHIVKGNFMTLSARPKTVEQGEWIAHQVVEHYRNLWIFVRVIFDKEEDGTTICNEKTCPRMSAGANHSFTWLNARREPVEVPAHEYISLMQRWISGKIESSEIFPTDPATVSFAFNTAAPKAAAATYASGGTNTPGSETPIPAGPTTLNASLSQLAGPGDWVGKSSNFPKDFVEVCQTIFRQMFRVYAHLYWDHFVEPFYHLNLEKQLNSCFSHFVLTATALDMLKPHELEPMQPLIDLWAANGTFPPESKAYEFANLAAGERLLALSGPANANSRA